MMKTYKLVELLQNHEDLCKKFLPNGSGFDAGCEIRAVGKTKIIIKTDFHHLDENGYYDGWTEHTVTVEAAFDGHTIKVSGKDRNNIKDYIAETFQDILLDQNYSLNWNSDSKEFKIIPFSFRKVGE